MEQQEAQYYFEVIDIRALAIPDKNATSKEFGKN